MGRSQNIIYEGENRLLFERVNVTDLERDAKVIVPDTHTAILIKDGRMMDTLSGGPHPIFEIRDGKKPTHVRVEVIWMSRTAKLKMLWGTSAPFRFLDKATGESFSLRAFGELEIAIGEPRKVYLELIAADKNYTLDDLSERLRGRILSVVESTLARSMDTHAMTYDNIRKDLVSQEIAPLLEEMLLRDYGLKLCSFTLLSVLVDEQDIERIQNIHKNAAEEKKAEEERRRREIQADKARAERIEDEERIARREWEREKYKLDVEAARRNKELEVSEKIGWRTGAGGKYCPNCGESYKPGSRFCVNCGFELAPQKRVCPKCGIELQAGTKFCPECGTKL